MQKITRSNPTFMPKPVGNYSHVTRVPKGAGLVVTSGQVGIDEEAHIPSHLNEQVSYTFVNMSKVLASEGLTEDNVIKVNIWATEEIDWDHFYTEWDKLFETAYPSMTVAYITALGWPELKIEIELWCADVS
ncbi:MULTISPECIES: RidA family protein [Gracilibacillus]|uniref:RidA family protein n=1 Tax=Gracilibacillus TaxID=74385 RepID=UPI000825C6B9|nr:MULTISPECIES: RidA family protein [Gracilibacillus]